MSLNENTAESSGQKPEPDAFMYVMLVDCNKTKRRYTLMYPSLCSFRDDAWDEAESIFDCKVVKVKNSFPLFGPNEEDL